MVKFVTDSADDAHLLEIANFGDRITFCSSDPPDYHAAVTVADATSGAALGTAVLTLSDGAGDWDLADGDVSGRKLTLAEQASITVSLTANANHAAVVSDARSALLLVTEITSQAVTQGNTATIQTFDLEVRDPT